MKTKAFLALCLLLLLGACGPIIGGVMVSGGGVKEVKMVRGSLADLVPGKRLAVLGPFAITDRAFYICRGEDAATFVSAFNRTGLFATDLAIGNRLTEAPPRSADWQGRSAADIQAAYGLSTPPDYIMTGTILTREMVAAPAQGVLMTIAYRLEFLEPASGRTVVVEVRAKDLFQDVIPAVVKELARRTAGIG